MSKKKIEEIKKGEVVLYRTSNNEIELQVQFEGDSVWLKQEEIAKLYGRDRSVITKHINKIFADKEVDKKSNVHFLHIANSDKPVAFYSLDMILAVGYRTNSSRAIHFRKWAADILKKYLIDGFAINPKRLLQVEKNFNELTETIEFLKNKAKHELLGGQEQEILSLLSDYSKSLSLLEQFDKDKLHLRKKEKEKYEINYEDASAVMIKIKEDLIAKKEASQMFGQENGNQFKAILKNIYQTFGGVDLYPSLEEKAAHLLYFIIKDHPFNDGNKRMGSFLFIYYLDRNNFLYKKSGEKKINDNALTALALLIAISDPKEKEKMIKIITNLIFN